MNDNDKLINKNNKLINKNNDKLINKNNDKLINKNNKLINKNNKNNNKLINKNNKLINKNFINYKKQNKLFENIIKNNKYIKKSFKINYIIFSTLIICTSILSINFNDGFFKNILNIFIGFIYLTISMTFGWTMHYLSHVCSATIFYKDLLKHFYYREEKDYTWFNRFMLNYFKYTWDFHSTIHHDSSINKNFIFIIGEIIINFAMEGGYIIILSYLFNWNINTNVFWFWSLLYATVHNINYNIIQPECHTQHHINPNTNFGIDTLDVIFGYKYDYECLENFNHTSINAIIITFLILYIRNSYGLKL